MYGSPKSTVSELETTLLHFILRCHIVFTIELLEHLCGISIAVKRRHNHGKSYKREHLTGAGLQFCRLSPLSSRWDTAA